MQKEATMINFNSAKTKKTISSIIVIFLVLSMILAVLLPMF
jgi:hypothetical protein